MRELKLEEIKKIELDILSYIDKLCDDNNLRYFLCAGTLIGAVRHQGFIPWDDDIDIFMPRPDYDKIINIIKNDNSEYNILSPGDEGYYYVFSKVVDRRTFLDEINAKTIKNLGVYVDIFPLEGMPDNEKQINIHYKKIQRSRYKIHSFATNRIIIRKNLLLLFRQVYHYCANKKRNLNKLQKRHIKIVNEYDYELSTIVFPSGSSYKKKDIYKKEWFDDHINVKFEERIFRAPIKYDDYLSQVYGDYMKLPPEEERKTHHHMIAYLVGTDAKD